MALGWRPARPWANLAETGVWVTALRVVLWIFALSGAGVAAAGAARADASPPVGYGAVMNWYETAAAAGDPDAQFYLGMMHEQGLRVARDAAQAARWYAAAAAQGHARAQFKIAMAYLSGVGVARDPKAAADWFDQAARQDLAEAQYNLGLLFETGEGVPRDLSRAAAWYVKAAMQGLVAARRNLALLYLMPGWVDRDPAQALSWLILAAEGGDAESARLRDRLSDGLDPGERARAATLAGELRKRLSSGGGQ